jgi:HEAT repeat protein
VLVLSGRAAAWDRLEAAAIDSDPDVAAAAVTLAGQLPDARAAAVLVAALSGGRYARSQVAAALDLFPLNIGDLVAPLLDDPDAALRYWGTVLMRRYPQHPALAIRIRKNAIDHDPLVRKAAIDVAAAVGGDESLAIARFGLDDAIPFVRGHAAQALATIGGQSAAPSIAGLLADPDWRARAGAKRSLVQLGLGTAAAVLPLLRHAETFARNSAAEVLQDVGEFERLLMLELEGASDPAHRDALELLTAAGGADMSLAVLDRLSPDTRRSGETILTNLAIAAKS